MYVKVSVDAGTVPPRGYLLHVCQCQCRCRDSFATGTPATSVSRSVQVPGQFRHGDTCYICVKGSAGARLVSPRGHLLHLCQCQYRCWASFAMGTPATSMSMSVQVPDQFRHGDTCYICVKGSAGARLVSPRGHLLHLCQCQYRCWASFAMGTPATSMSMSVQVLG